MKNKNNNPVVHFKVELQAKDKTQYKKLIKELVKRELDFSWRKAYTDEGLYKYILTVDSCWGGNLEDIGRIIRKEEPKW